MAKTAPPKNQADQTYDLLILGGDADPNITRLVLRCNELGINFRAVLVGKAGIPAVTVDVAHNTLIVQGKSLSAKSVFIRPNVFDYLESKDPNDYARAQGWFALFIGSILANPEVRFFNRRYYHRNSVNKLETLLEARKLGFLIPETYFSNDIALLNAKAKEQKWIEKPVEGGAHTRKLAARDEKAFSKDVMGAPVIVQQELVFPEIRVFRIGDQLKGFRISSDTLDYRDSKKTSLVHVEVPQGFDKPFFELTERLGLEYAAADFKTDPATGDLMLLEVNSGPMFAGFDQVCKGKLTQAMLDYLLR